jgi:Flp pilus assembly protein TadB
LDSGSVRRLCTPHWSLKLAKQFEQVSSVVNVSRVSNVVSEQVSIVADAPAGRTNRYQTPPKCSLLQKKKRGASARIRPGTIVLQTRGGSVLPLQGKPVAVVDVVLTVVVVVVVVVIVVVVVVVAVVVVVGGAVVVVSAAQVTVKANSPAAPLPLTSTK